jgi:hypothetical protein
MCNCAIDCFLSDYNTSICPNCGIEKAVSIIISPKFSSNQTLSVGYSRINRFRIILDQLFNPLQYGCANSQVLAHLNKIDKNSLKNGGDMIKWLTALPLSDKRYQCVHFYFAWYLKTYHIPPVPNLKIKRDVEMEFGKIEANFRISEYKKKSFFSYNWLLLKLLLSHPQLKHYIQFVKRIKCKHRFKKYLTMYQDIMNVNSADGVLGDVESYRTQPVALLGGDFPHHRRLLSYLSDRAVKNDRNKPGRTT